MKAFYLRDRGAVTAEQNRAGMRMAFFEYMGVVEVHRYDPVGSAIGVRIYGKADPHTREPETSLPAVGDIFGKLKLLMAKQGHPSRDEYAALVKKYRPVADWHFARSGQWSQSAIVSRCETAPAEQQAAQDMEAMGKQAEALMMQGRTREALELMQRLGQSAQGVHEHSLSPEGVKKWTACLETLREHGYPTRIEIAPDPAK